MRIRWLVLGSALAEAWPLWLLIAGLVSSWWFAYFLAFLTRPDSATQVRYWGVMLEVFGFILVAWGIRQLRQSFGRPSLIKIVGQWFQQIVSAFRRPKAQTISLSGIASGTAFGNARFVLKAGKESSLERRIEVLEQNLDILRGEFHQKADELETKLAEANKAVQEERSQRLTEVEDARQRIEEISVGGLQLEIVGWFWLVLGTIGSNLAEEISRLISLTSY